MHTVAAKKAKSAQNQKHAKTLAVTGSSSRRGALEKKKAGSREKPAVKKKVGKSIAPKKPGKRKSQAIRERPLFSIRELAVDLHLKLTQELY